VEKRKTISGAHSAHLFILSERIGAMSLRSILSAPRERRMYYPPRKAHDQKKQHGVGRDLEVEVGQGMDEQGHDGSQAASPEKY
jgi:hypothetical protein